MSVKYFRWTWISVIWLATVQLTLFSQQVMPSPPATSSATDIWWQPEESALARLALGHPCEMVLPLPEQGLRKVFLSPDNLLPPGLQLKYPQIRVWEASQDGFRVCVVSGPSGIHALFRGASGTWLMEPQTPGKHRLAPLHAWEAADTPHYSCGNHKDEKIPWSALERPLQLRENQVNLYQYVLAVATTGEFFKANGNTPELVMENVVKVIAQVNTVMIRDVGIKLVLAEKTDTLFFSDGVTDPYTNGNTSALLSENITVVQSRIPFSQFDVGHVFGTNAGGQAFLGAVCGANKASGASSTFGIYNGPLFYLIVAHELGHQFGASHTFNFCDGDNESSGTAYEPGSGSTIMCYAGASDCGVNYVQDRNDPYFHHASLQQITNFKVSGGARCAELIPVNNVMPTAQARIYAGTHIPRSTPLRLDVSAQGGDKDVLSYCWEQYNLGPRSTLGSPTGDAPAFRSLPPSDQTYRIIPNLTDLLTNRNLVTEVLPNYARRVTFRITVRDNHPQSGSFAWDEISFRVDTTAGPFKVLFPNSNRDTLYGGMYQLIRWDVANTNNSLVNCKQVNIFLSLNGGFTWSDTLAMHSANDGSEYVFIPPIASNVARIIIEGDEQIFFDLSDRNGVIVQGLPTPSVALVPNSVTICAPGDAQSSLRLIGIDPDDLQISLANAPEGIELITGEVDNNTLPLTIRINRPYNSQTLTTEVRVRWQNDTLRFALPIQVVSSVLDPLTPTAPVYAQSGLAPFVNFTWLARSDATQYQLQVSTSPSFSTLLLDTVINLTSFANGTPLEAKTIYFWRVRAINSCRAGAWSPLQIFQTEVKTCKTYTAKDTPFFGVPPLESSIQVEDNVVVSEVNLPKVHGFHEFMGNVTIALRSPLDSQTILLRERCTNLSNYNLGFDDQAQALSKCPLTDQKIYKPEQPLAKFINQPARGLWTLRVTDKSNNAGTIQSWALELCTQSATNVPVLDKNLPLTARVNTTSAITAEVLKLTDPDTGPEQLVFTLLTSPAKGSLLRQGVALAAGNKFTQADVNSGRVTYRPFRLDSVPDNFDFIGEDGQGGWISPQTFLINIEQETALKTYPLLDFSLSPNPASHYLLIRFIGKTGLEKSNCLITLADVTGKIWYEGVPANVQTNQLRMNLPALLPGGLYLVTIRNREQVGTQKLVIQP